MHTTVTESGRPFHHNGDFSGDVILNVDADKVEHGRFNGEEYVQVTIPMEDLVGIVGEYVRRLRIERLEHRPAKVVQLRRRAGHVPAPTVRQPVSQRRTDPGW